MKPNKYAFLSTAKKAGVQTPDTLFLEFEDLKSGAFNDSLNNFIDQNLGASFIVRSCVAGEDGNLSSMAGHFYSSEPVKKEVLVKTVQTVFDKNKALASSYNFQLESVNLMIQPYINAQQGGILFSRWKYFSRHFVGEVSLNGAEAAVTGAGSESFVLSKNGSFKDLKTLEYLPSSQLKDVVKKLETLFNQPLDVEWLFDGSALWVVQVRPVSRSLKALRPATKTEIKAEAKNLKSVSDGDWQLEGLAESLGELSPLSFSVITHGYHVAQPTFKQLGFRAAQFNFLGRARNGQIYVNAQAYQDFFKLRGWFTPFLQTVKGPAFEREISTFYKSYTPAETFDLSTLTEIFKRWQIANVYAAQSNKEALQVLTWPDEYEVLCPLKIAFPTLKEKMRWSDWRDVYKQWWLWEYEKLKQRVQLDPLLAFSVVEALETSAARSCYEAELPFSAIDFPISFAEKAAQRSATAVVKGALNSAPVYVVKNPKTWRGTFPSACVLVAPYFDNAWVGALDKFKGIVLEQGGVLSHSAIVAREKKTPYYIHWSGATTKFKTGDKIEI